MIDWIALAMPPLIWVKTAWASPYLKTYRHGISASLSGLAGGLMFASLRFDQPSFPIFLCASAVVLAAMFIALLRTPSGLVKRNDH